MSKLCDTCIYRNNVEQLKPCIIYRDDCELYEKESKSMNDDLISRQAVLDKTIRVNSIWKSITNIEGKNIEEILSELPSVNPQEPKTGQFPEENTGIKLDEAIERYASNAEFERTHGNLQGCLEFRQLAKWLRELKMYRHYLLKTEVEPQESEVHCNFTDAEIAKSFIEDVEAVKDLLPQESNHKCHTCKHYTSGEHDGSCGSYICKNYSDWESEEISDTNLKMWEEIFKAESEDKE